MEPLEELLFAAEKAGASRIEFRDQTAKRHLADLRARSGLTTVARAFIGSVRDEAHR